MITRIVNVNSSAVHCIAVIAALLNTNLSISVTLHREGTPLGVVPDPTMAVKLVFDKRSLAVISTLVASLGCHFDE